MNTIFLRQVNLGIKDHLFQKRETTPSAHDIGDVSEEHEIQLGIWHHGRVATHGDYQKNHFRKDFPAI